MFKMQLFISMDNLSDEDTEITAESWNIEELHAKVNSKILNCCKHTIKCSGKGVCNLAMYEDDKLLYREKILFYINESFSDIEVRQ